MMSHEFSERPLVAGSLIGIRSFAYTPAGLLCSPIKPHMWSPGENVARCGAYFVSTMLGHTNLEIYKEHKVAHLKCSCGFYGYFDTGDNSAHDPATCVLGIIEAYGTVTVGTRGFRAEKAKLLGIIIPSIPTANKPRRFDSQALKFYRFFKHGWTFPLISWLWALAAIWGSYLIAHTVSAWGYLLYLLMLPYTVSMYLHLRGLDIDLELKSRHAFPVKASIRKAIQDHYPNVKIFNDVNEAIKEFPLVPPPK